MPRLLGLGTEYYLFGGAGLISVLAFAALILVPAIGSYGRTWEKATAALLSLFVLAALLLLGRRARRPDRLLLGRHHADPSRAWTERRASCIVPRLATGQRD